MHGLRQPSGRLFRPQQAVWALLALLLGSHFDLPVFADTPAKAGAKAAPAAAPVPTTPEVKRPSLPARKRVEFVSAIMLWFSVLVVGLGLVVMVMVWGRRLRRSLQRESLAPTVPDPLWYLKKSPSTVAHGNQPDRLTEKERGQDPDERPAS
jgi:hypothetical protein